MEHLLANKFYRRETQTDEKAAGQVAAAIVAEDQCTNRNSTNRNQSAAAQVRCKDERMDLQSGGRLWAGHGRRGGVVGGHDAHQSANAPAVAAAAMDAGRNCGWRCFLLIIAALLRPTRIFTEIRRKACHARACWSIARRACKPKMLSATARDGARCRKPFRRRCRNFRAWAKIWK